MDFKRLLLLIFMFLGSTILAQKEYTVETVPNPKSETSNGFISNPDTIVHETTEVRLDLLARSLEKKNGTEVAIILLHSIGREHIKDFAVKLVEHWGVGKKGADNGLLILFVEDQRSITFETGYGIEGDLPDALCKRIQMEKMIPLFKKGNYDEGMIAGMTAVVDVLKKKDSEYKRSKKDRKEEAWVYIVIVVWTVVFIVIAILARIRYAKIKKQYVNIEPHMNKLAFWVLKFALLSPPLLLLSAYILTKSGKEPHGEIRRGFRPIIRSRGFGSRGGSWGGGRSGGGGASSRW